ncbi:nitroreductase [Paucilactobacillus kaifaensis]|uniref:nitroreductase n=1 Tax=Paucilactobacillus kaifaensis TaxID=2559921 RepID=UPI0010F4A6A6|nr:nitroreductase [Paucilactobacillus kaifaensis]
MEFNEALMRRHAIRSYTDQPVSIKDLKAIVAQAQKSPSWVDSQPWKVYIATGKTVKKLAQQQADLENQGVASHSEIPTRHRKDWAQMPRENMAINSKRKADWATEHNDDYDHYQKYLYNAPAVIYLTIAKNSPDWSKFDLGMFASTLMLSASAKEIDSIPSYALVKYPELERAALDIPEDETIFIGIALGYQSDSLLNQYRSQRSKLDDILVIKD